MGFYQGSYPFMIVRNPYFFAKIQGFLYKYFKIKRTVPCGRLRKEKYLCCCQKHTPENTFLSKDRTSVYCKVCGSEIIMSNRPFKSLEDALGCEW